MCAKEGGLDDGDYPTSGEDLESYRHRVQELSVVILKNGNIAQHGQYGIASKLEYMRRCVIIKLGSRRNMGELAEVSRSTTGPDS